MKSLDGSAKILEKLPRASKNSFDSNGLVVGHVQAGKAANYTGTIAKAADQGYNLFIVFLEQQIVLENKPKGLENCSEMTIRIN